MSSEVRFVFRLDSGSRPGTEVPTPWGMWGRAFSPSPKSGTNIVLKAGAQTIPAERHQGPGNVGQVENRIYG